MTKTGRGRGITEAGTQKESAGGEGRGGMRGEMEESWWKVQGSKTVYNEEETAGLRLGEPVPPIIAAPRRPRDSPSSSHATRTSSDQARSGSMHLQLQLHHRSSVTAAPLRTRLRARVSSSLASLAPPLLSILPSRLPSSRP